MKTVTVMFGMDTHEISVSDDGTVKVKVFTDRGTRDGGSWEDVYSYIDDMWDIGFGGTVRRAFLNVGIITQ